MRHTPSGILPGHFAVLSVPVPVQSAFRLDDRVAASAFSSRAAVSFAFEGYKFYNEKVQ